MTCTITVDPSWLNHPDALGRILSHIRAVESPAPWSPPVTRQPGDDEDLRELLSGMDDAPEASAPAATPTAALRPPAAATPPAGRRFDGEPATGRQLYRWAIDRKILPKVNAAGKKYGYGRLVSDWSDDQAVGVYHELTAEPAASANGRTAR
jgi:hypothetical protein